MTIVDQLYQHVKDKDFDAFVGLFADDFTFTDRAFDHTCTDVPAFQAFITTVRAAFGDFEVEVKWTTADETHFAAEIVMHGTFVADLYGHTATGRRFSAPLARIGEHRDGRIVRVTDHWNVRDLLR